MFYFNPQYLLFMAPAILVMLAAQWYVKSTYRKWGQVPTSSRLTGEQVTQKLILTGGLNDLNLREVPAIFLIIMIPVKNYSVYHLQSTRVTQLPR